MRRNLTYLAASLLLFAAALTVQLSFGSPTARARQEAAAPEERCERDCSDRFEECARRHGAASCRPAYDLCRQDSPKAPRGRSGRSRR